MTIREIAIAKLQQLPEPLVQQVSDFIDLLVDEKSDIPIDHPESERAEACARWFESVNRLEATPTESFSDYQKLLLAEYRQQGQSYDSLRCRGLARSRNRVSRHNLDLQQHLVEKPGF